MMGGRWRVTTAFLLSLAIGAFAGRTPLRAEGELGADDWELRVLAYETETRARAYERFLPFADAGNPRAQTMLGNVLSRDVLENADYAQAAEWYRLAASQGDGEAMLELSELYRSGRGVLKDYNEAWRLMQGAAEAGYHEAQRRIAIERFSGSDGLQRDHDEGLRWYRLSAYQGNEFALTRLADIYANLRDESIQRSYALGYDYSNGLGVPKDNAEAVLWFRAAAERADSDARRIVRELYEGNDRTWTFTSAVIGWYHPAATGDPSEAD